MMQAVAMYVRLSSEDADVRRGAAEVSESVFNQRAMLNDYIKNCRDFAGMAVLEFVDDGWSGKTFERPAFKEMMAQARQGKIVCIVVKDISRLGRDYLTIGAYLSRIFPFLGVRCIAVNDGYDSARFTDIDSLDTSFKALIYDLYSRDLSGKVKSAKLQRAKRGTFLSPYAPFGYEKDSDHKNRLLIDKAAARTVRSIYALFLSGKTTAQIARTLNDNHVLTPMLYKQLYGCARQCWPSVAEKNFWTRGTVLLILRDERYAGKTVYGRKRRKTIGENRTAAVSREKWVIVENTHEAIISEDVFQEAQRRIRQYARDGTRKRMYPLYGRVFCGICRHAISREAAHKKYAYYLCGTNRYFSDCSCPKEKIPAADLEKIASFALLQYARYIVDTENVKHAQQEEARRRLAAIRRDTTRIKDDQKRCEEAGRACYEAFAEGKISRDAYMKQKGAVRARMEEIRKTLCDLDEKSKSHSALLLSGAYEKMEELTEKIADGVVERIYVYPGNVLEIKYKIRGSSGA